MHHVKSEAASPEKTGGSTNLRLTLFGISELVLLLALASALVSTQPGGASELAVQAAEAKRQIHRLSDLLRQSTDDPTRMVRLYAVAE